ncbi:hypothetical protein CC86DRAFT_139191 [Ophiobolus disseminans]|uniref:Uncharacterized protein n=1 Tax=Ophiobolus disseminans TaxID=1469910 RepID=A0A6A7AFD5_9PLEO|nr:hypothetical protein CC86DRAFT_139191 [Ophiobolus disseminans]
MMGCGKMECGMGKTVACTQKSGLWLVDMRRWELLWSLWRLLKPVATSSGRVGEKVLLGTVLSITSVRISKGVVALTALIHDEWNCEVIPSYGAALKPILSWLRALLRFVAHGKLAASSDPCQVDELYTCFYRVHVTQHGRSMSNEARWVMVVSEDPTYLVLMIAHVLIMFQSIKQGLWHFSMQSNTSQRLT